MKLHEKIKENSDTLLKIRGGEKVSVEEVLSLRESLGWDYDYTLSVMGRGILKSISFDQFMVYAKVFEMRPFLHGIAHSVDCVNLQQLEDYYAHYNTADYAGEEDMLSLVGKISSLSLENALQFIKNKDFGQKIIEKIMSKCRPISFIDFSSSIVREQPEDIAIAVTNCLQGISFLVARDFLKDDRIGVDIRVRIAKKITPLHWQEIRVFVEDEANEVDYQIRTALIGQIFDISYTDFIETSVKKEVSISVKKALEKKIKVNKSIVLNTLLKRKKVDKAERERQIFNLLIIFKTNIMWIVFLLVSIIVRDV